MLQKLLKSLKANRKKRKTIRILNKYLGFSLSDWQIDFILTGNNYHSVEQYGGRQVGRSTATAIRFLMSGSSNAYAYAKEDIATVDRYYFWCNSVLIIFNHISKKDRKFLGIDERVPEWIKKAKHEYISKHFF